MQKDSTNVNCRTGEVPGPPWPQSSLMMGDKWGGRGVPRGRDEPRLLGKLRARGCPPAVGRATNGTA